MPIYRATITGRTKPLLIRAETAAKGVAQLVTLKALTADEMTDALATGEAVWKVGDDLPPDRVPEQDGGKPAEEAPAAKGKTEEADA